MDKLRLQALRRLLFFSRQEAALWVAAGADRPQGVTDRSWRMWEDGTRHIPDDVAENIERLVSWRAAAIKAQSPTRSKPAILIWFDSLADWLAAGNEAILWRPQQSVCAAICASFESARLVPSARDLIERQHAGAVPCAAGFRPPKSVKTGLGGVKNGEIDGVRFFR